MSDATRFEDFARISADWFWETDIEDRFTYFSVPVTRTGIVLDGKLGLRRRDGAAPATRQSRAPRRAGGGDRTP